MAISSPETLLFDTPQWVCKQCGYNMIGHMPDNCPFCGAGHGQFMTWQAIEQDYRVNSHKINGYVSQLLSVPRLGYEHAAYRVDTWNGSVWIDCPSAFNRNLAPVKAILFTHHHFMGAANQYRRLWHAEVWLHVLDAKQRLAALFDIDRRFSDDFTAFSIEAFHIGGHTPGFSIYIYREVLFICDYVFMEPAGMRFNPYGPAPETIQQCQRIYEIVKTRQLTTVCGYNYVAEFSDWFRQFESLVKNS